jgi:hypothetical protein
MAPYVNHVKSAAEGVAHAIDEQAPKVLKALSKAASEALPDTEANFDDACILAAAPSVCFIH